MVQPKLPTQAGDRRRWSNLPGAAETHAIASAIADSKQLSLVISADTASAERLEQELAFFLGDSMPILRFPDWETLIYDSFSPHQDIISDRLDVLNRLPSLDRGVLVVPAIA